MHFVLKKHDKTWIKSKSGLAVMQKFSCSQFAMGRDTTMQVFESLPSFRLPYINNQSTSWTCCNGLCCVYQYFSRQYRDSTDSETPPHFANCKFSFTMMLTRLRIHLPYNSGPIYIKKLVPGGSALLSGQLQVNDIILQVNNKNVDRMSYRVSHLAANKHFTVSSSLVTV